MPQDDDIAELSDLPEPPFHEFVVVADHSEARGGYLRRISRTLRVAAVDGEAGRTFAYDEVDRRGIDAVVVVPYYFRPGPAGLTVYVILRSALRPPVALRDPARAPRPEPDNRALWEVPAGLIEPEERGEAGLRAAAARELCEETGFSLEAERLVELGPSTFPCPGVIAERQFFFRAEVEPGRRETPGLDGSPLEAIGELVRVPLGVALEAARNGRLADAKTELALRRLEEALR